MLQEEQIYSSEVISGWVLETFAGLTQCLKQIL